MLSNSLDFRRILHLAVPLSNYGQTEEGRVIAKLRNTRNTPEQERILKTYLDKFDGANVAHGGREDQLAGLITIAAGVKGLAAQNTFVLLQHHSRALADANLPRIECVKKAYSLCLQEERTSEQAFAFATKALVLAAILVLSDFPTSGTIAAVAAVAAISVGCKLSDAQQRANNIERVTDRLKDRFYIEYLKDPKPVTGNMLSQVISIMHSNPESTSKIQEVINRLVPHEKAHLRSVLNEAAKLCAFGTQHIPISVINSPLCTRSEREAFMDGVHEQRMSDLSRMNLDPNVGRALTLNLDDETSIYFCYCRAIAIFESLSVLGKPPSKTKVLEQLRDFFGQLNVSGLLASVGQQIIDNYKAEGTVIASETQS